MGRQESGWRVSRRPLRAVSELAFQLDGSPGLVALSALADAFRSCRDCRRGLHVLVCADLTLEVSCGHCKARWRTFRSGQIIRRTARSSEACCFVEAFSALPVSGQTVIEAPLFAEDDL